MQCSPSQTPFSSSNTTSSFPSQDFFISFPMIVTWQIPSSQSSKMSPLLKGLHPHQTSHVAQPILFVLLSKSICDEMYRYLVYNWISFDKCVYSCNHHGYQTSPPEKCLILPFRQSSLPPPPAGSHFSDIYHHSLTASETT